MAWDYLRWYHGTASDPKWRAVAKRAGQPLTAVVAVWALMLERASENAGERRGTLANWSDENAACALDIEPDAVAEIRTAMQGKVLDGDHVLNWEKRQPKREDGNASERAKAWRERKRTQTNANEHKTRLEETRIEKNREERVERAPAAAPAGRGTRLSIEVLPDDWRQFCSEKRPDLDPSATFDRFRDHWIAAPGQRGVKRDWAATWRNWVRNEHRTRGSLPEISDAERIRQIEERQAAREAARKCV